MKKPLLDLPVGPAVKEYLLHLCKQADNACIRLQGNEDKEALHDFRVSIRRIRTWLGAYHHYLLLHKRLRKRLRDLVAQTNLARDAEVSVTALERFNDKMTEAQKVGLVWALSRFENTMQQAYADILIYIPQTWPSLAKELRHSLGKKTRSYSLAFSQVSFELLNSAAAKLAKELESIKSLHDMEAIHQSRIAAKRLRYLLEPYKSDVTGTKTAVKCLTSLQDVLGTLHDGYVLKLKLSEAIEEVARLKARCLLELVYTNPHTSQQYLQAEPDEQQGLLELVRLIALNQGQKFADAQTSFLGENAVSIIAKIRLPIDQLVGG